MTRVAEFIEMLSGVVSRRDPVVDADFSTDGPDFVYLYSDVMENEAPRTNELIQTGDVVDHMDGWMTGEGTPEYYDTLNNDLKAIKQVYSTEVA